ncbi:MAG: hypothetical protein AAB426_14925 [Myxococcota bacterium]
MTEVTLPDGWRVAHIALYREAVSSPEFASNILVQLRTDATDPEPERLAHQDIEQLRDSGRPLHSLERNEQNGVFVQECVYDGAGGERLWQRVSYLRAANGIYSVAVTDVDGADKVAAKAAVEALVAVLRRA